MKIYEIRNSHLLPQFSHRGNGCFYNDTYSWKDELKNKDYFYESEKFKTDISVQVNHLILSDSAKPYFEKYGSFFEIKTLSKRKKFIGFFPNKCIVPSSVLNLKLSEFREVANNRITYDKVVFNKSIETISYEFFVVDTVHKSMYVSEKMKEILESSFLGLDFFLIYDSSVELDWKFQVIKDGLDNPDYEDVIRKVYGFSGDVKDFDLYVTDKEIVEEQPFLKLYEKYQSQISTISKDYPLITEYQVLCVLDKNLRDFIPYLKKFNQFLIDKNIFLKTKYIGMFPSIEYFDDGVMVGGHFAKGLTKKI